MLRVKNSHFIHKKHLYGDGDCQWWTAIKSKRDSLWVAISYNIEMFYADKDVKQQSVRAYFLIYK